MAVKRPEKLPVIMQLLPLPVYFPSVSSVKTALPPQDYVKVLASLRDLNGHFLVSAFDLAGLQNPCSVRDTLEDFRRKGGVVLMDSGNYESFWKNAQHSWKQADFHRMLYEFPCDLAFGFDEQVPPANQREHVDLILARWREDQAAAGECCIVPIIHATATDLPFLCAMVAKESGVKMLAVAERKLGDGILARAHTVQAIKAALSELEHYVCLHLLGTGNPISLAIYSAMGADSFDGLEWCQTVVDYDTVLLYHLSQSDFFASQTGWGDDESLSFHARTLAHNLEFFNNWMKRIGAAQIQGRIGDFCQHNLPARVFQHCTNIEGWASA